MDPRPIETTGDPAWGSVHGEGVSAVETLNQFLGALVRDTWDDLDRAFKITENLPDFSGVLPLGDPTLLPYLNKPGVFFILGPQPSLSLLHIGASRGPIGFVIRSRIAEHAEGGFEWRWETRSDLPPTYAAIATMEDYWAFAPPLRTLLARKLGEESPDSGDGGPVIPLV